MAAILDAIGAVYQKTRAPATQNANAPKPAGDVSRAVTQAKVAGLRPDKHKSGTILRGRALLGIAFRMEAPMARKWTTADDTGFAPTPGSNDAANYGYGRQGVDGSPEAYAPPPGSNDSANYGYGRQGAEALAHVRVTDDFVRVAPPPQQPDDAPLTRYAGADAPAADPQAGENVRQRLNEDWMVDASNIDVAMAGREVVLSGTVATRAQRQRAEDLVREASGVSSVRNHIRVDNLGTNGQ
jgi:hypothetical protein